jgi:hypothetical protein
MRMERPGKSICSYRRSKTSRITSHSFGVRTTCVILNAAKELQFLRENHLPEVSDQRKRNLLHAPQAQLPVTAQSPAQQN